MEKQTKELKLARGILFRGDEVLLVQDIRPGQGHYFLPGGSVELGESVPVALVREWKEELGWEIKAGNFLGCLEATWSYQRKSDQAHINVFEMNYLFAVNASPALLKSEPKSLESHLQFSWVSVAEISSLNLLPNPLKQLIPDALKANPRALWASGIN
ncbi:MAG: NUDIX domain-containing protein [Bdellovibrionota bacterium]